MSQPTPGVKPKVKIISKPKPTMLESEINDFIQKKEGIIVDDIQYRIVDNGPFEHSAMIIYRVKHFK